MQIRTHAQQLTLGSLDLIDIYIQATKDPFSYLFINLTQECQPQVKYLSKLFYYDHSVRVYRLDKSRKMKGATNCTEMSLVVNVFSTKQTIKIVFQLPTVTLQERKYLVQKLMSAKSVIHLDHLLHFSHQLNFNHLTSHHLDLPHHHLTNLNLF